LGIDVLDWCVNLGDLDWVEEDEFWILGGMKFGWNQENWNPVEMCWTISGTGKWDWEQGSKVG
jgi:hypothetical protein